LTTIEEVEEEEVEEEVEVVVTMMIVKAAAATTMELQAPLTNWGVDPKRGVKRCRRRRRHRRRRLYCRSFQHFPEHPTSVPFAVCG
jgi:hypothetical protein